MPGAIPAVLRRHKLSSIRINVFVKIACPSFLTDFFGLMYIILWLFNFSY